MKAFILDPLYIETGVWRERAALYIDKNITSIYGMFDSPVQRSVKILYKNPSNQTTPRLARQAHRRISA